MSNYDMPFREALGPIDPSYLTPPPMTDYGQAYSDPMMSGSQMSMGDYREDPYAPPPYDYNPYTFN